MIHETPFCPEQKWNCFRPRVCSGNHILAFSQVARFLDDCEFQDYIDEAGWWDQQIQNLEHNPFQATDTADATSAAAGEIKGLIEVGRLETIGRFAEYN